MSYANALSQARSYGGQGGAIAPTDEVFAPPPALRIDKRSNDMFLKTQMSDVKCIYCILLRIRIYGVGRLLFSSLLANLRPSVIGKVFSFGWYGFSPKDDRSMGAKGISMSSSTT